MLPPRRGTLAEVPLGLGSGRHREMWDTERLSPGGLFSCLGIYCRSNERGRGEKENWKRSGGDGDWLPTETTSLCSQLTLFSVVAAPSLQTGKRVFRTDQS